MTAPRPLRGTPAVVAALLLVLAGCTGEPPAPAAPVTASPSVRASPAAAVPPARQQAAQADLDALVRAVRGGDQAAAEATLSGRDPGAAQQVRLLSANLRALPLVELRFTLGPVGPALPAARLALLGDGAWRQHATVRWRLAGEREPAQHTLWLTFALVDGAPRLAGTGDTPDAGVTPTPVWMTGAVTARHAGSVTVVTGAGQPTSTWLARASAAAAEVRRRVRAAAADRWRGGLVVEVPATRAGFEAVVGAAPGSYADVAAVTHAEGPDGAVRVVLNPEAAARLTATGVAVVAVHEAVHVATHSPGSPAPTWAVEGLADEVALAAHPGAASGVAAPLLRRVRAGRLPTAFPADEQFQADPGTALAYAEAWTACRSVADRYGDAGLQRLYAALDRGEQVDAAAEEALGTTRAALVRRWRADLRRQAGG